MKCLCLQIVSWSINSNSQNPLSLSLTLDNQLVRFMDMRHREYGASKVTTTKKEQGNIPGHRKSQSSSRNFANGFTMVMYLIIIFLRISFSSEDYTDLCLQI